MRLNDFYCDEIDEKPLDHPVTDGGYTAIFRTIGCVGDSLASGEFESMSDEGVQGWHDMFEYSWGQYLARMAGCTVLNFSRGGMTAKEYCESFAEQNDYWNPDKKCQAYVIALGVNDVLNLSTPIGTVEDIHEDWHDNAPTFVGYYAQIVQRLKENQPYARFFFMTMPCEERGTEREALKQQHRDALYAMADYFDNAYVLDIYKYGSVYDEAFRRKFFLSGHMTPAGYLLTARMVASYIDYIVRHNPGDFKQIGFMGTPYYNKFEKR